MLASCSAGCFYKRSRLVYCTRRPTEGSVGGNTVFFII